MQLTPVDRRKPKVGYRRELESTAYAGNFILYKLVLAALGTLP